MTDDREIQRELSALSPFRQLAFALLLCERMMPALRRFGADTGFEISCYQTSLQAAWQALGGTRGARHAEASQDCLKAAPDTERCDHPLTSAALDAAVSLAALMSYLADGQVEHIVEISGLALDTAALRAQLSENKAPISLDFAGVMTHTIVRRELLRQAADIKFVAALAENRGQSVSDRLKQYLQRTMTVD